MHKAIISGVGHYVPERVVTNADLEKMMDTSDEWIRERSGIHERHFIADDEQNVDMAEAASRAALAKAGKEAADIDFIIYATLSPEYFFPGSGCLLQERLTWMSHMGGALILLGVVLVERASGRSQRFPAS